MATDTTGLADLPLAHQLASLASEIALHRFPQRLSAELKPDGSPVTAADREIEQALVDILARLRPDDAVLGEELGARGASRRRWLLDPIDGTSNFLAGDHQWGTHIALQVDNQVVLGVITRPTLATTWWACRGHGAYRVDPTTDPSGIRLQVSSQTHLASSRVTAWTTPSDPIVSRIQRAAIWVEPDLNAILRLAEGQLEVVIDALGKPWDHAPAIVLVEEAGGTFSDRLGGHRLDLSEGRYTNGFLHDQVRAVLTEEI
jgi:histidinol-phosphatase